MSDTTDPGNTYYVHLNPFLSGGKAVVSESSDKVVLLTVKTDRPTQSSKVVNDKS